MRTVRLLGVLAAFSGCGNSDDGATAPVAADAGTDAGGKPEERSPVDSEGIEPEAAGPGCDKPSLTLGESTAVELEHEGGKRTYIVHAPAGIDPAKPTPLVLNFHGLNSNAGQQQLYAGNAIADLRGYVVAYPQGLGDSFNGGPCCSSFGNPPHMADDVGFAKAVIADVAAKLCIDRRRIYSTGMSNGGYMSEHNACEAADVYAAVAPVSAMGLARTDCKPSRAIPMIAFNGTEDTLVSYETASTVAWPAWVDRQGCTGKPKRKMYGASYCDVYDACKDGVELVLCTVTGMAHCWPGNPLMIPSFCPEGGGSAIDANAMMYDLFKRFALPD